MFKVISTFLFGGILFIYSSTVFAVNQAFEQRFDFIREDGKLVEVRDRSLTLQFNIRPLVNHFRELLLAEQALMKEKHDYFYEVENLFYDEMVNKGEKSSENIHLLIRSLQELEGLDVDKVFNDPVFQEVIERFEERMNRVLSRLNPNVLARLDDPTFFYYRNVTYQVVSWGLSLAKRMLSSVPALNTASYILVEAERMIVERRTFHQNLLMHYLENFEDETGLEADEVNAIYSSIYESRIPWFAFWESQQAQNNWQRFGVDRFYGQVRAGNARYRQHRHLYEDRGERINFAFQEVQTREGEHLIVNLLDGDNQFNSAPAHGLNLDNPWVTVRRRVLLQLGGLGTSFLPIPQFIKGIAENYFRSFYETQRLTEGALFGHFESLDDLERQRDISRQYLNPFEKNLILQ